MKKSILKKIIPVLSLGIIATLNCNISAMAYEYDSEKIVSVALETVAKAVSSVTISNNTLYIGYIDSDSNFVENGTLSSTSGFSVSSAMTNYVGLSDKFTKTEAEEMAKNLSNQGYTSYVACLGELGYTVFIENQTVENIEDITNIDAINIAKSQTFKISNNGYNYLFPTEYGAVLKGNGENDTFQIENKSYRGFLSFHTTSSAITPINVININEYLYGVVPAEMPHSYNEEALKSQAIAARTYVISKKYEHSNGDYLTCDKIHCQVYSGYSMEKESTNNAINNTDGEIILYDNEPIEAMFFASSGGYTENVEDVWNEPLPYLKAVPELYPEDDAAWFRELSTAQVTNLADVGAVSDIIITKLSTGGRIQEVKIIGANSTKTVSGDEIRAVFGSLPNKMFTINDKGGSIGQYGGSFHGSNSIYNSTGNQTFLNSARNGIKIKTEGNLQHLNGQTVKAEYNTSSTTNPVNNTAVLIDSFDDYEINSVYISTKNDTGNYIFNGIGNGHGVGLSQKGANSMAEQGYTYREILTHYYTGVEISG